MSEFFEAVRTQTFLQLALAAGALSSVACGIMGTYVVVRRISYIAAGIAHCVLGGLGAARYLNRVHGIEWLTPLEGALIAALLAAGVIGLVSLHAREREDTIIGAIWAGGMAAGVLFIWRTPGYNEELMSYLFGNILLITRRDLGLILALDIVVVALTVAWYNPLLAVCFDEEFARIRGARVQFFYLLLLGLTAVTVVLLVSVAGIVLVIALLTLPAATASHFARSLSQMMILATLFALLFTTAGLALSYGPDLPAGATIVAVAGTVYLVATATKIVFARL